MKPNDVVKPIHDRIPAVFEPEDESTWLGADQVKALTVADSYEGGDMAAYEVSPAVNDPTNDQPDVILPAGSD